MGKKNINLSVLCAIIAVCTVAIFIINVFDIKFNVVSYHTFEQDGYSFTFKGSFDTVRRLVIKKDSKKLCSLPFDAASDVFSNEFGFSAKFHDADKDGKQDLILPHAVDSDGDVHYTLFLADAEDGFVYNADLASLSNLSFDSSSALIFTEETTKEVLAEATKSSPEYYINRHSISKHSLENGHLTTLAERAITYYSENDYYCYSIYEHDEAFGGLKYVDEIWFEPSELGKYPLDWN